jgi:hypothetical protein
MQGLREGSDKHNDVDQKHKKRAYDPADTSCDGPTRPPQRLPMEQGAQRSVDRKQHD